MSLADPMEVRAQDWSAWIGRSAAATDVLTRGMVSGLLATLDSSISADYVAAPQGIHWLIAPTRAPMHDIGPDGHPTRGGFLPPSDLPRRMWAGSDVHFLRPLLIGDEVERLSRIASVEAKQGSTGPLLFVAVDHQYRAGGQEVVNERHTIVYRDIQPTIIAGPTEEGSAAADFERILMPDPVLLFRYSALTFNSHRIHYDFRYATKVELYPDLVVHGPLMATLLLDLCAQTIGPNRLARFSFRAVAPAFSGRPLRLAGTRRDGGIDLVVSTEGGRIVMRATATVPE